MSRHWAYRCIFSLQTIYTDCIHEDGAVVQSLSTLLSYVQGFGGFERKNPSQQCSRPSFLTDPEPDSTLEVSADPIRIPGLKSVC